jgi:pimeloyl-ACP methyl ester carboxylesterase
VPSFLVHRVLGDAATQRLGSRGLAFTRGSVGVEAHRAQVQATHDAFVATPGPVRSGFLVAMSKMDYRRGLASIGVPTTVLVGTHDRLTPPGRARELAAGIRGAELTVLPGKGHMLPLEAPDEVADAIARLAT